MTAISRVRTTFTGLPGGAGVATHYFLDTDTAVASLHTFWGALAGLFPAGLQIQVISAGDTIEDTNGELTGAWGASAVAVVNGGGTSSYAAPVGGLVTWGTDTILDGHRLRGRTFMVPLSKEYFGPGGGLGSTIAADIETAADALVIAQSESMVVWHRPREAKPADGSVEAVTARDGGHGLVVRASCYTKAAVLRSRRD